MTIGWPMRLLGSVCVVATAIASTIVIAQTPADVQARIAAVNNRLAPAIANADSMECILHRQEYKRRMLEPATVLIKRDRAGNVFVRFIKGTNSGREILYRPGKNDGKILVTNPVVNLSLDPNGKLAMHGNRFPITWAGLTPIAERILKDVEVTKRLPAEATKSTWLGSRTIGGEPTICYRTMGDKARYPELFAFQTEVCTSENSGLPIDVKIWDRDRPGDKKVRLVGHYRYENCRFNHLTETDFDQENPDYNF